MKIKVDKLLEQFITQFIICLIILVIVYSVKLLDMKYDNNLPYLIKEKITYSVCADEVLKGISALINDITYRFNEDEILAEPVILIDKEEF